MNKINNNSNPPNYLSKTNIKDLFEAVGKVKIRSGTLPNKYIDLALKLGIYAGLRVSEMAKLTPSNIYIDNEFKEIRVLDSKRGRSRNIPLFPGALLSILNYLNLENNHINQPNTPYIPLSTRQIWVRIKKVYKLANIEYGGTHQLRHTFARRMIGIGGLGMPDVQYLLGHSSTQITQRYVDAQFTSNNQYINEAMLKINKLDNE